MIQSFLALLRAPLDAMRVATSRFPALEPRASPGRLVTRDELARLALACALIEVGNGEVKNAKGKYDNHGPDIRRYCAPHPDGYEWCAAFWGFGYALAAKQLLIALPFERSLGAKALARNVAKVGRRFTDPVLALPGDLVVGHRGPQGSFQGHAMMFQRLEGESVVVSVEGNHGPKVKADVKRDIRDPEVRFSHFASVRTDAEAREILASLRRG